MDNNTVEAIRAKVMPGEGNAPSGRPSLKDGKWTIPFKSEKHGVLQAFLMDRIILNDTDFAKAVNELEQSVGLANLNCL